jgi:uncharacterized protein (TIGR03790 family)
VNRCSPVVWPFLLLLLPLAAQSPADVLLVINQSSPLSRQIGDYYTRQRHIPPNNVCAIRTPADETIARDVYDSAIAKPIGMCLKSRKLQEQILYIVTTAGVPLIIKGRVAPDGDYASVDSELTLLYSDLKGNPHKVEGALGNPFYGQRDTPFRHPQFPMYLVTRLAGYDFADVKGLVDHALVAKNTGKFVIDLRADNAQPGNEWLRTAALLLPKERVELEETEKVVYGEKNVIGYAGWGSNDHDRHERHLGFQWLPGAIMTEFVSTNGRTFRKPPASWNISSFKNDDSSKWWAGSPQTLTADYVHEGVTGASGQVEEPYLALTPRPDYLLPAYFVGRNLAESYYLSIPGLSWQNIVIGDPLCSLGKP